MLTKKSDGAMNTLVAEFVAGVRAYRVMDHQLLGDLFREQGIKPASDVNRHQFLVLALVVCFEFRALNGEVGLT